MKAEEQGLLVDEGPGRELGGSVYFSMDEVAYFMNMLGIRIAKLNLKKAAKRKRNVENENDEDSSMRMQE
jgi:hypothetical protein